MVRQRITRKAVDAMRRADPAVKALALGLRRVILDEIAPCREHAFAQKNKAVLLFAASDRVIEDCICQIHVFTKYVVLAFPRGVDLTDSSGVLEGSGKTFRYLRVMKRADIDRPEI